MSASQNFEAAERRIALYTILLPLAGFAVAVALLFGNALHLIDLALLVGMYFATVLGISLGYHRLFTHRSYKCPRFIAGILAIAGCMAAQGPVIFWTACHRVHHQCSDAEGDPHSPHRHGMGFKAYVKGFWHAHTGWMIGHAPLNYRRLCPDLLKERWLVNLDRRYFLWVGLGLLLPGLIAAAFTPTVTAFCHGVVWGGLVRIFLAHHATWSVNSICHLYGAAPYATSDESRNNPICALLTFGEGWHNNHHAFPASARHGLAWWELDCSYLIVRVLGFFHLAWEIRTPSATDMFERRVKAPRLHGKS